MSKPTSDTDQMHDDSVHMVEEALMRDPALSLAAAAREVAPKLGIAPQTLLSWVNRYRKKSLKISHDDAKQDGNPDKVPSNANGSLDVSEDEVDIASGSTEEAALLSAIRSGNTSWTGSAEGRIKAGFLRKILTDECEKTLRLCIKSSTIVGHLDLRDITLTFPLEIIDCRVEGWLDLNYARIERLQITRSQIGVESQKDENQAVGIMAHQLTARTDINIEDSVVFGGIYLTGATIGGRLSLDRSSLQNPNGDALVADGARILGGMSCGRGFRANGRVRINGARIDVQLALSGGGFNSLASEDAINADGLQVIGSMFCSDGFFANGKVCMNDARIDGQFSLIGGRFLGSPEALSAERMQVSREILWSPDQIGGGINFSFAEVALWSDNRVARDAKTILIGLSYRGIQPPPPPPGWHYATRLESGVNVSVRERLWWIREDPTWYSPQPYAELARAFRAMGHDSDARKVLIASEKDRRRVRFGLAGWVRRKWGILLNATVGFGYRPWRALYWLVALVVSGGSVFHWLYERSPEEFAPLGSGAPPFNAWLYVTDELLPFVDFGYNKWVTSGTAQACTVVLIGLGWVLATALVSAAASMLRRAD